MSLPVYPYTNMSDTNLDWLIKTVKTLEHDVINFTEWKNEHEKEYLELKAIIDEFNAGHFTEPFITNLKEWIVNNVNDLISYAIKNVWFGLTDSGYFVAYIPDSWNDITFNTIGYDIDVEDSANYGRLCLSY